MNSRYKNIIILVVILLAAFGGYFLFGSNSSETSNETANVTVGEGEILVQGEIACLPYRAATAGQGCVKGIKGDDGKIYALNSIAVRNAENNMAEGTKVSAVGSYEPADTSVDDSSVFKYDGVLVLSSIEER